MGNDFYPGRKVARRVIQECDFFANLQDSHVFIKGQYVYFPWNKLKLYRKISE
jgi:type 1 glutamine amidotransferase